MHCIGVDPGSREERARPFQELWPGGHDHDPRLRPNWKPVSERRYRRSTLDADADGQTGNPRPDVRGLVEEKDRHGADQQVARSTGVRIRASDRESGGFLNLRDEDLPQGRVGLDHEKMIGGLMFQPMMKPLPDFAQRKTTIASSLE